MKKLCGVKMKAWDELVLVNYCYPDCTPLLNIMRLPREEAFQLAGQLARKHPDTTAFYRFADFENYYDLRSRQDAALYARFVALGGMPEEEHPLSFVVEGSDYLRRWFGQGIETRLPLRKVVPHHVSFTIGDSGAEFQKSGRVELLTVEKLHERVMQFGGDVDAFLQSTGRHYVEAQLWSDQAIRA